MNSMRIESVCVFGSRARCSMDTVSDKDVLVISSDHSRLQQIKEYWKNAGWSVASYMPNRFEKMIDSGSLFVQHIKLEGIVVEDRDDWLKSKLDQARPKHAYGRDAMQSVSLALPIERFRSNFPVNDNLLVADIAYVAVRNFGICHLANEGKFVYDYSEIVDHLSNNFILSDQELTSLKNLRLAKAAYRNGKVLGENLGTVREMRNLLSKFFPHRPLVEINRNSFIRNLGSGYSTLRDFEAAIISQLNRHPSDLEINALGLKKFWRWMHDPRSYSWEVRNFNWRTVRQIYPDFNRSLVVSNTFKNIKHAAMFA